MFNLNDPKILVPGPRSVDDLPPHDKLGLGRMPHVAQRHRRQAVRMLAEWISKLPKE